MLKRVFAVCLAMALTLVPVAGAEEDALADCPYIGDRSQWELSPEQAGAYAAVIDSSIEEFKTADVPWGEKAVYATLVDVDGSTLLWIANVTISDYEPDLPGDFPIGNQTLNVITEEIWEFDGKKAVELEIVSKYGSNVNLWADGLEIYTYYKGTDVDGQAWSAFFPFQKGKISEKPQWTHAWAWIYEYKLEYYEIFGDSRLETVQAYFDVLMDQEKWPRLEFDWDTLEISDYPTTDPNNFYGKVTGGSGYEDFIDSRKNEYGDYYPEWEGDTLLRAADIGKQDGSWKEAALVADCLEKHASSVEDNPKLDNSESYDSDEEDSDSEDDFDKTWLYIGISVLTGLVVAAILVALFMPKKAKKTTYTPVPALPESPENRKMAYCPYCGAKRIANAPFCGGCGKKIR